MTITLCDRHFSSASGCVFTSQNNTACTDNNACTTGDISKTGVCTPTGPTTCEDNKPCTANLCNVATGCTYQPDRNRMYGRRLYTINDVCTSGTCGGSTRNCDDGKLCTTDTCDSKTGCTNVAATGTNCTDGDACTGSDTCTSGGVCAAPAITCNDNNVCTVDSCSTLSGCAYTYILGAVCDDGLFCTVSDSCNSVGNCIGSARDCDEGNECTTNSCNETTNVCTSVNNTAVCSDGDACTINDQCSGGSCLSTPVNCDDSNSCTTGKSSAGNCLYTNVANDTACTTGEACTVASCTAGTCLSTSTYWARNLSNVTLGDRWSFDAASNGTLALQNEQKLTLMDEGGEAKGTLVVSGTHLYVKNSANQLLTANVLAGAVGALDSDEVIVASLRPSTSVTNLRYGTRITRLKNNGTASWYMDMMPLAISGTKYTDVLGLKVVGGYVYILGWIRPTSGTGNLFLARLNTKNPQPRVPGGSNSSNHLRRRLSVCGRNF